jgi:hypothetical protein
MCGMSKERGGNCELESKAKCKKCYASGKRGIMEIARGMAISDTAAVIGKLIGAEIQRLADDRTAG